MRFTFDIPITEVITLTEIRKRYDIHYKIPIKVLIIITKQKCGMYILPIMSQYTSLVKITTKRGILNENNNVCRPCSSEQEFRYITTQEDVNHMGGLIYEYDSITKLIAYEVKGSIKFVLEITKLDQTFADQEMLLSIWQAVHADTLHDIKQQNERLIAQNEELQRLNDELVQNVVTGPKPIAAPIPAPVIRETMNIDTMDKALLIALRNKIDEAVKKLETCAICMTNPFDTILNCQHVGCRTCMEQINKCHVCRADITSRKLIFA